MKRRTEKINQQAEDREFFLECEKHWVFWSLILVGGFYGAYTFMVRGGVFCNAQTANVVLLSMAIGSRDWSKALYLLIPISAYFMGAILSEILAKKVKQFRILRWDTILVGLEIPMVLFLGALPASAPDQICQVMLNFICSMQFNTFRQNEGIPMATTFVTNHIRQTGSNLVKAVRDKDPKASLRWKMHGSMILVFLLGGLVSTLLCEKLSVRAIWGIVPVLLYTFIRLMIADMTYEKDLLGKVPRGHS
ncbi:MAG: DUF1275 domain-containing protein [Eubacterium sp.]|nr:DUF1275 domain-containing protein [Eubacterium sp.]